MGYAANDLIKETSTTTGTGAYTLAGAMSNYRPFSDAGTPAAGLYVPYVARMAADYEIGVGELTAAGTLGRFKILHSSNANAAVNWGAGTKTLTCAQGALTAFPVGRHNINASTYPSGTDNYTLGYGPGSLWLTDFGWAWYCYNPGNSGTPTAHWINLSTSRLDIWDSTIPRSPMNLGGNSNYDIESTDIVDAVLVGGDYGYVKRHGSQVHGFGNTASTNAGGHQRENVGLIGETADATPTVIYVYDLAVDGQPGILGMPESAVWGLHLWVTARNDADNVASVWEVKAAYKRSGSGNPALLGTVTKTVIGADAGASAWDVALGINTTDDSIELTVTGQAAKDILWTASVAIHQTSAA